MTRAAGEAVRMDRGGTGRGNGLEAKQRARCGAARSAVRT